MLRRAAAASVPARMGVGMVVGRHPHHHQAAALAAAGAAAARRAGAGEGAILARPWSSTAGKAVAMDVGSSSRKRALSSSSSSGCLGPSSFPSSRVLLVHWGHWHRHHHEQARQSRQERQRLDGTLLPTKPLRALLSTVPPKDEDRAKPQAPPASSPASESSSSAPPTPSPDSAAATETKKEKPSWKDMLKKHGPVFLVYWNAAWLASGLSIYAALTVGGVDPMPLAYAVQLDRLIDLSRLDPAHGNVAVAIVLNEAAELVRFPLVVATVPRVTRWWERVRPDFMKPKLGPDGKPKPTMADQIRRHGPVFVVWWGTLWAVGAAGLFGAFEYHWFGDVDAISLARSVNLDQFINLDAIPPSMGNLGVAVAFNEALEIVRFPIAVATVPFLTRWWEARSGGGSSGK